MIQKQTWLNLSDSSSILWLKTFHLYGGFFRKITTTGYYIKGSIRILKPQIIFYKGFYSKKFKRGNIKRALIIRDLKKTSYSLYKFNFNINSAMLIKKKNIILSKYVIGPSSKKLKNKRLLMLFKFIY